MTNVRREKLRSIMNLAWELFRNAAREGNPRTFADALAGAWRWTKRLAAAPAPVWAKGTYQRTVALKSVLYSPIRRRIGCGPYAETRGREAGRMTSRLGN